MNERIKELAYEAEDYADSIVDQGGEFHPAYTKKFAELIVKRIIDNVECHASLFNTKEARQVCSWIVKSVKYDFGVSE